MIQLPAIDLSAGTASGLAVYQGEVDQQGDYASQVRDAKRLFSLRNKKGDPVFDDVKTALDAMCSGARRCAYCEDSMADEVEHVRPKDLYPEVVFVWSNYIYACGPCNGPKGSRYSVFEGESNEPTEVARKRGAPIIRPQEGPPALVDPRSEDATRLMLLDVRDTFWFAPIAKVGTRDHARAAYTIAVLGLNSRDALTRARRAAYDDYFNAVRRYQLDRDNGAEPLALAALTDGLRRRQHPTVWREMKRSQAKIKALRDLFAEVPEALEW